jgi:hypothetical protein
MKLRARAASALLAAFAASASLAATACDVGQGPSTGIGEPLIVANAQFIPGDLPPYPDAGPLAADAGPRPLTVLVVSSPGSEIVPGGGLSVGGSVTDDTAAVGVRLVNQGTGYWVLPVGVPDLTMINALTFGVLASFDPNDPPGKQLLRFQAIGGSGAGGIPYDLEVCMESRIPDNGHACRPSIAPPGAVFSLQWDTNFDLDLHVTTPSGQQYSPKLPLGETLDADTTSTPKNIPFIDRDSLRGCVPDGLRQEDLVFPEGLTKGRYDIYVDPYAACGQNQVHFTFAVYQSSGTCPDCNLHQVFTVGGELLASQVTGGTAPPLFVHEIAAQ